MAEGNGRAGRVWFWDNAKVILIALVVFTHLFELVLRYEQPAQSAYRLILLFHMPAFVFVTGYFSKSDLFTRRGARSLALLVWAFLIVNGLNHLWSVFAEGATFSVIRIVTEPYFALWFLQAMIWWNVLLPVFSVGTSRASALVAIIVSVLIATVSGYLIREGALLTTSRALYFLPFFVAGWRARQQHWSLPRQWWTRALAVAAFGAVFAALYWGNVIRGNELLYGRMSYAEMGHVALYSGVVRVALYGVSAALIAAFLQLVPRRRLAFTALGFTTLSVYVWHAFGIRLIRFYDQREFFAGSLGAVFIWTAVALVAFGVGPLARSTVRILTGRKVKVSHVREV